MGDPRYSYIDLDLANDATFGITPATYHRNFMENVVIRIEAQGGHYMNITGLYPSCGVVSVRPKGYVPLSQLKRMEARKLQVAKVQPPSRKLYIRVPPLSTKRARSPGSPVAVKRAKLDPLELTSPLSFLNPCPPSYLPLANTPPDSPPHAPSTPPPPRPSRTSPLYAPFVPAVIPSIQGSPPQPDIELPQDSPSPPTARYTPSLPPSNRILLTSQQREFRRAFQSYDVGSWAWHRIRRHCVMLEEQIAELDESLRAIETDVDHRYADLEEILCEGDLNPGPSLYVDRYPDPNFEDNWRAMMAEMQGYLAAGLLDDMPQPGHMPMELLGDDAQRGPPGKGRVKGARTSSDKGKERKK